jgi:hypothetical protein
MRIAAVITLALALPAGAAPILDLEVLPGSGFFNVDNDADSLQQFTTGTAGSVVRIDLFARDDFGTCAGAGCLLGIGSSASLSLFAGGSATARVLDDWISFTFDTPLAVNAGDTLFFDVTHDNFMVWGAGAYSPGASWSCAIDLCTSPSNPDPFDHTTDVAGGTSFALSESYAFRIWIEPTAAPEPAALGLAAAALALLPQAKRAARRSRAE